ncbi:MAG: 1-acyl-sn-glycerol-3-phosphate acyltransferase [Myxococcales bacterium]|nr:1-acyl-sn-glycerol-3-phosphate acyltransferase [Myxococcales bacterium]
MRSRAYRIVVKLAHLLLRAFFRRVEVTGLDHLPKAGGGILVSWHPNGVVDPALIFETFPRTVVFGARHGLFRVPILGAIMRAVGTVPIYRASDASGDEASRRAANERSLDALAGAVLAGHFGCLFPEGDSHDSPHLLRLKTGVARFYYRARELSPPGASPIVIVPVGLHYEKKHLFRSDVLVTYHPPITLPRELDRTLDAEVPEEEREEVVRALTRELERVLVDVVHATESWDVYHLMHRARTLTRAERARRDGETARRSSMKERQAVFARIWRAYEARKATDPEGVEALQARLAEYDADLRALGLEDHELDRPPQLLNVWLGLLLVLQAALVYLLLPPLLFLGYLVNGPPALLLLVATKLAAKRQKDVASIKLFGGALLFLVTWTTVGVLTALGHFALQERYAGLPDAAILSGVMMALLSAVGGAVALRYLRLVRETARALRVRLTRHRRKLSVAHLLEERDALHDALVALEGPADDDLP